MGSHLFFSHLALCVLVWLLVMLHLMWSKRGVSGVIAPFPPPYAANGCCGAALTVSTQVTGSGFEAKYRRCTSSQTRLNRITRRSTITCPPAIVHDIPERLSRCVKTTLHAASVLPDPRGHCWRW